MWAGYFFPVLVTTSASGIGLADGDSGSGVRRACRRANLDVLGRLYAASPSVFKLGLWYSTLARTDLSQTCVWGLAVSPVYDAPA